MTQVTELICNLKNETLRFAAAKDHTHENFYTKEEASTEFAPKNHKWKNSDNVDYGQATADYFGHVKRLSENISANDNDSSVPDKTAVIGYVTDRIDELEEVIKTYYGTDDSGENVIENKISQYDMRSKFKRYSIASPYQFPNHYDEDEKDIELEMDMENDKVDSYLKAGHYHITPSNNENQYLINYNGQDIKYANGLLEVRTVAITDDDDNDNDDGIYIQDLYTTDGDNYTLTGEKYTRMGVRNGGEMTWGNWKVAYMPEKISTCLPDKTDNSIDEITITENTAGYNIKIANVSGHSYTLSASQNQWNTIADISPALDIDNEYIFGNTVANMDIKIAKNKIQIRSKQQKGSSISVENITTDYFVPRKG